MVVSIHSVLTCWREGLRVVCRARSEEPAAASTYIMRLRSNVY